VIGDFVQIGENVEIFPGAVIGREPKPAGAVSRAVQFSKHLKIGNGCSIGPHSVIYYDVEIGTETLIGDGASIREQCRIGCRCIISRYVTVNYNTSVGDDVKVMDLTHLTGNMKLEDGSFVSCLVATMNDNAVRGPYGDQMAGPTVGRGAVVGGGAILLPSVAIGEGAFVGSGAVVTRSIPQGETWLGNPARARQKRGSDA
jgi:acetyltransferase-like isoleucine patch superfamily enzyme